MPAIEGNGILWFVVNLRRNPRWLAFCMYYGSEFSGRLVDLWVYANKVTLEFSRPGKPTDIAFIESFSGSLRDGSVNTHWFSSLKDAQQKLDVSRDDYNGCRPHKALDGLKPP